MSSLLNRSRFGAHGDVMGASPSDEAGKTTLCDEIKSRARAEFARKNLPQAEMLYSKAVEIRPEDATLYSNLAAVRLGLNKPGPALENAVEALRLDPAYAKGHYRKGQALMALTRPGEAAEAYRAGAALEPESKLWAPLVEKAEKAAASAPASSPTKATPTEASSSSSGSSGRKSAGSSKSGGTSAASPAASTASSGGGGGGGGGSSGSGDAGAGMKGYKITADGKKTTYFNNDLTEEAKALIGDIAPKKLEPAAAAVQDSTSGAGNEASAWNKAGTWESRDMTSWAKQRLDELLVGVELDASESVVKVVKVDKLEGDAEISFSRGKKRYMFDFRFELKWEAPDLDCGPAKGVLMYPDVGQDCDGVYDVECRVDSSTPTAARGFVDRHVRPEGSGLREAVLSRLTAFTTEYYSK
ncbi:unnamed protein product [Ectocarpus sp. 12 AP-2014]